MLVLSGDPRPGNNHFDHEVAVIRSRFEATNVDVRHLAGIELGEISAAIDRERPAVVHLCAHSGPGGLSLSLDGRTLMVAPAAVADAVLAAEHRPRCVVLNFCHSEELRPVLVPATPDPGVRPVSSIVSWPGAVDDDQAALFAEQLYRQMSRREPLRRCVAEAARVTLEKWPELDVPRHHGPWRDPAL